MSRFYHSENARTVPGLTGNAPVFSRSCASAGLLLFVVTGLIALTGCHSIPMASGNKFASSRHAVSDTFSTSRNGSFVKSKSFFNRTATEAPTDYRIDANVARTHFQNGEIDQAIVQMKRAVEMSGGDSQLHVELGEYYLASGLWLQAQRHAELGLEKNHRLASAWFLKGKTKAAKNELREALGDYQRALGYDATRQDIQMEIAQTYGRMNQPMKSLAAVEQLLSQYPRDEQPENAVLTKSVALMKLQQLEPAIDILEVASRNRNATSQTFLRLGQAQLMAGQDSQARLTLARAQQAFPDQPFEQLAEQLRDASTRVAVLDQ